jgi:hypothetical protein
MSNLPKIFMIGWEFPPHNSGGLGIACAGLTGALACEQIPQVFVLPKQLPIDTAYVEIVSPNNPYFKQVHINLPIFPYGGITREQRLYLKKRNLDCTKIWLMKPMFMLIW